MNRFCRSCLMLAMLVVGGLAGPQPAALAAEKPGAALPNPFFAYCVGIGTGKEDATLEAQLQLPPILADLGYAGMAYVGLNGAMEMIHALEEHGEKMLAVYTPLVVDPDVPGYDPRLDDLIPKLKGHGTIVWLVLNSKKYEPSSTEGDARAVELLRHIADLARKSGVEVSLYPHKGCYAQRMEDVLRLVKKVDRPNVGVSFTFCHFLAVDDAKNMERVLKMARPHLDMVTINGTSGYDPTNRAGWIQVLGEGSFDVGRVLKILRNLDYRGPIGIIAFGIKGDRRELLSSSMEAWKKLSAQATQE